MEFVDIFFITQEGFVHLVMTSAQNWPKTATSSWHKTFNIKQNRKPAKTKSNGCFYYS